MRDKKKWSRDDRPWMKCWIRYLNGFDFLFTFAQLLPAYVSMCVRMRVCCKVNFVFAGACIGVFQFQCIASFLLLLLFCRMFLSIDWALNVIFLLTSLGRRFSVDLYQFDISCDQLRILHFPIFFFLNFIVVNLQFYWTMNWTNLISIK